MPKYTDTELLDFIEKYKLDIDSPMPPDENTFVIYGLGQNFDKGLGCSKNLRTALSNALDKVNSVKKLIDENKQQTRKKNPTEKKSAKQSTSHREKLD